jgi:hypothetical protein
LLALADAFFFRSIPLFDPAPEAQEIIPSSQSRPGPSRSRQPKRAVILADRGTAAASGGRIDVRCSIVMSSRKSHARGTSYRKIVETSATKLTPRLYEPTRRVLMPTKLALSGARRADVTGLGVPEHHGDGSAIANARPKL